MELTDADRKAEGLRMLLSFVGRIEECNDRAEIVAIGEQTRSQIMALYAGSSAYSHDYQRFDGAVNAIMGGRICELGSLCHIGAKSGGP